MDCVTADSEQLHTEVFRSNNLESVIMRCEQFFALMPSSDSQRMNNGRQ